MLYQQLAERYLLVACEIYIGCIEIMKGPKHAVFWAFHPRRELPKANLGVR